MRRIIAAVLCATLPAVPALAVGKNKAKYVGGTVSSVATNAEGSLSTAGEEKLVFVAEKGAGVIEVPYTAVNELEYGQKAGRKVKEAILLTPIFLFSKRRQHYLTVSYTGSDGKDQAVILELGKDLVRTTLAVLEARTGKKVVYQDEEAAKARAN